MPSIGELFVTLGAKTDASMAEGLRKLQQLGATAQQMTNQMNASARMTAQMWGTVTRELGGANAGMRTLGATSRATVNEIKNVSKAMRNATLDAKLMTSKIQASLRTSGNAAMDELRAALGGGGTRVIRKGSGGPETSRARKAVSFAQAHLNMMGLPPNVVSRIRGGERSDFNWGEIGNPFDPGNQKNLIKERQDNTKRALDLISLPPIPGQGGGGRGRPGNRPGGGGGGRPGGSGRPGGGGFNRPLGPIGDISAWRRVLLGAGIYQAVTGIGELADTYTRLQMRVAQVTKTQEEADSTFNRLRDIARNTKADLETTTEAYVRIKNATEGMKLSQEDTYKFVERLNMAIGTSGASASEARSGMMQLTQALAKGKLDGDEFRSIAENMPNILKILEKQLGKTEAQLRQMSHAGTLTRESIVKAFLATKDLKAPPDTFASAWTAFKNDMLVLVGTMAKDAKLVQAFKDILAALAKLFIVLAPIIASVIKHIAAFVKDLSDAKPYAIALAIALGTMLIPQLIAMAFWLARMAKMPFTMIIGQLTRMKALMGGDFKGAAGISQQGGAAGGPAKAGTKAAGGMNGLAAAGGPIGLGLLALDTVLPNEGPSKYFGALGAAYKFFGGERKVSNVGGSVLAGAQAAAANINVGPTTVNIYTKDLDEAQDKFSQEMVDRMMRHAAGAVNRPGS